MSWLANVYPTRSKILWKTMINSRRGKPSLGSLSVSETEERRTAVTGLGMVMPPGPK